MLKLCEARPDLNGALFLFVALDGAWATKRKKREWKAEKAPKRHKLVRRKSNKLKK